MAKAYQSATAFKRAFEARLRQQAAAQNIPLSTLQLKFTIERLLARLFRGPEQPWLLKGGFAMDLRFRPRARTSKDVDLSVPAGVDAAPDSATLWESLQEAVDIDLGDYLNFRIGKPQKELANAPDGGARFPCEVLLDGKSYKKFHIDIGCGDAFIGAEQLTGDHLLSFVGIEPIAVRAIPQVQQFAEKTHAYTLPRTGRVNNRSKDLVDLVLLIERGSMKVAQLKTAIEATFSTRKTHSIPKTLPAPPVEWNEEFAGMAIEAGLSTQDCGDAFGILVSFWTTNNLGDVGVL